MADFKITQNDTYPAISGTCKDDGGNPVDITGATVRFHLKAPGSETPKVNESASILDAAAGRVAYQWIAGDTDTPGTFFAEFEVTHSDGNPETFPSDPLVVYIREELA
ncbi:DUF2479 domain-containing protein [Haloplanus salinus]|jgi:hypothetical protein|uniref:DUF2479 domain-containing protein n=1 Tax=Haloplanus salinus TaxID=1126245 RepID=A0A368NF09_9EURY|nr:BppU family phage baseplate upper protein [Haloplanus salinus]RCU47919.1 DUF2479 domain-containing protein [Haloplanus salinus]